MWRSWLALRRHSTVSLLVLAFSTVYCLAMIYPTQEMLFYYEAIWPPSSSPGEEGETSPTADSLVDLFAVVFGAGGFVCAVGGGWCCDKVGIAKFTLAVSGCCFATSLLLLAPYYWPQALAQVGLTLGFSLYMIVCTRYTVLYAPPELFGSMSGLLFTAVSVFMGVGAGLVDYAAETLAAGRSPPLLQYQAPFLLLGLSVHGVMQ